MANFLAGGHAAGAPGLGCRHCVGMGARLGRVRYRADPGLLPARHSGQTLGQSARHRAACGISPAVDVLSGGDAAALDTWLGLAPPALVLIPCASITASTLQYDWMPPSKSRALPYC